MTSTTQPAAVRAATPSRPRSLARATRTALVGVVMGLLACGAMAAGFPLTVSDDLGRAVTLDERPLRIVSLAPSHSESVCALEACDRLVGVDRHSDHPAELVELASLGDAFAPDLEAIVMLRPDLVLVDEYSSVHLALEPLGITVFAGTPQTYDETLAFLTLLGTMLGAEERAAGLVAEIEATVADVAARVAGAERPTVFFELDSTPYSVGPNSFIGQVLDMAGAENIVTASMGDFPQVDPEFVVLADPAFIVLSDAPFGESAASVAARPGWGGLAAVTGGRVVELSVEQVNLVSRAGPRIGHAVELLARLFHPELF